ncbi:cytochrome P450 [Bombardia bombarda]|uniref:Cytochrome P450 n=1 Tax=Bombardia bombarda TaxID=252184 RepID=A0AA39XMM7_9PEZI|nr:cytochrome P450 [Bombardia bombarda]
MTFFLFFSLLPLLLLITHHLHARHLHRRFALQHGCLPARRVPQPGLLESTIGYRLFRSDVRAARKRQTLSTAQRRFRTHGHTFAGVCLGQYFITTIDGDNVKALLSTRMDDFDSGKIALFGPFIGQSMLTSDGAVWRHARGLVRPHLVRERVVGELLAGGLEGHFGALMRRVLEDGKILGGGVVEVDLKPLFGMLMFDNTMEMLLGVKISSLEDRDSGSRLAKFVHAFESVGGFVNKRAKLGPLLRFYQDTKFERQCKVLHDFVDGVVREAYEKKQREEKKGGEDGSSSSSRNRGFLASILEDTSDLVKIRFEVLGVLLAGRDTAADLMGSLFFVLARRPDVWGKLKEEVDRVLAGANPRHDSLKELTYHRYVIEEALRLYPPAPVLFRAANKTTLLPRGGGPDGRSPVLVPRGTVVSCSTFALQRRRDIYGDDADEFRPERWEAMERLRTRPHWEFLPFSAGPRVCMGQNYAMAETVYVLARMAQEFDAIEPNGGPAEWVEDWNITVGSGAGAKVRLTRRKEE